MKCPKCQNDNPEKAKYCMECANPLQAIPPSPIDFTQPHSYTPKFLADKILTTRSAMEGERKRVTVLFADVAGFTSMSEKLDPEQVHQIMDGCFKILMDEIHNHQGTINQFTGDGVMALFGAPVAIENHARNACQAALAIQNDIKEYSKNLNKKFGFEFKMRIGMNSGPVIVGSIGDDLRMDYTAVGDTTNLASRMESMAKPGTILVSPVTYKRVSQQFHFKALGKTDIKGKEKRIAVFELIEPKVDWLRLGHERQIYSEMIGRQNELNLLEIQINKAINGEGSVVNVIGEAGIGKSRLIAELRNSIAIQRVTLLEGRALSIGRNLSFHPIIDLIRQWARIKDSDSSEKAYDKLERAIRSVCPEDADEIFPFMATLMGMKLSGRFAERIRGIEGEALEKLILKNLKDLITQSTGTAPIVIVIEDFHWADTSSVELIESLLRLAQTHRILFINVFRPNHPETGDRIIKTIKEKLPVNYLEINLQPLSAPMSELLIQNMLNIKGIHHSMIDQVIERSGGNPFFIEEVMRSFIDEGAVVKKNGEFEVTAKIEKTVIPQTIQDVLMARIDRLDDKTRELIKVAAVIGKSFFYRIVAEVARNVEEIDTHLSYLKEIELIRERRRLNELEFLFTHALAQETAYESILNQNRKKIHLEVARSIEKVFSDRLHEFYGMLAFHYIKGEDHEKAAHYLRKAGEEALRSSASREALNYYQEGLKLYLQYSKDAADPYQLAMFEKNIAIALYNKCQWAEAVQHFDKALYYMDIPAAPNRALVLTEFTKNITLVMISQNPLSKKSKPFPGQRQNEIFDLMYKKGSAMVYVDNIRFLFNTLNGFNIASKFDITRSPEAISGIIGTAGALAFSGLPFQFSYKLLEVIKNNMDRNNVQNLMAYTMMATTTNTCSGQWEQILSFEKDLVDNALKKGDLWNSTCYMWFMALIKSERGDLQEGGAIADELFRISDTYDYNHAEILAMSNKADLLLKKHQLPEAQAEAELGVEFSMHHSTELHQLRFLGLKAEALALLNDVEGAKKSLAQAEKIVRQHSIIPPVFIAPFLVARLVFYVHQLKNDLPSTNRPHLPAIKKEAFNSARCALKKFRKYAPYRTKVYRLTAELYCFTGNHGKACKWWNRTLSEAEKLGTYLDLSRAYFEIGRNLITTTGRNRRFNGISAEEYLEKAKTLFQEMDLKWDLGELDKVMALK